MVERREAEVLGNVLTAGARARPLIVAASVYFARRDDMTTVITSIAVVVSYMWARLGDNV